MGELVLVVGIAAAACVAIAIIIAIVVLKAQAKKDGRVVASTVGSSPTVAASGGVGGKAWPDVEKGESKALHGEDLGQACHSVHEILTPTVRHELCMTLKAILEEEIARGLERAGIGERIECLEKKVLSGAPLSPAQEESARQIAACCAVAPPPLEVYGRCGDAVTDFQPSALPASPPSRSSSELAGDLLQGASPSQEMREALALGPTARQRSQLDPPEKASYVTDEDTSLRGSLAVVQRQLGKRDAQTTELHRQLRDCRQSLWLQTQESRLDRQRLQEILSDPAKMPGTQAEELKRLQQKAKELSDLLAEARAQEMQWSTIAKRQRAFFMQSERMAQDSANSIRKHPAGEIFLAPPPICLEDDGERLDRPSWDIGTLEANPYVVDSWPFEPNAMAQRAAQEPDLCRLDEGEDEDLYDADADSEDGAADSEDDGLQSFSDSPASPQDTRPSGGMRLPSLPSDLQPGSPSGPIACSLGDENSGSSLPPLPQGFPDQHAGELPESARSL